MFSAALPIFIIIWTQFLLVIILMSMFTIKPWELWQLPFFHSISRGEQHIIKHQLPLLPSLGCPRFGFSLISASIKHWLSRSRFVINASDSTVQSYCSSGKFCPLGGTWKLREWAKYFFKLCAALKGSKHTFRLIYFIFFLIDFCSTFNCSVTFLSLCLGRPKPIVKK